MNLDFIPSAVIEEKALEFLGQHHPSLSPPIPIEEIIEINLKIKVIPSPGLLRNFGIDAFSTHDFSEIYIDERQLFEIENRARFTLAHEMGHFVLHKKFIKDMNFESLDEWKIFVLRDLKRGPLETQANMFAGFLLLPTQELIKEFESEKSKVARIFNEEGKEIPDDQTLIPYLAKPISELFKVSQICAENRLRNWLGSIN